ncbi:hypothetical protein BGZ98_001833 [Dissophora globulifera]|nr:hypothetical protein BGZ98_001833 [Dissophora globulifera]
MTTLYAYSTQYDDLLYSSSSSSSLTSILDDYRTVSQIDLFHFSDPDHFKSIERHADVRHRRRDQTTLTYLSRKVKHGTATANEQHTILRKLEQRRNRNHDGGEQSDSLSDGDGSTATESEDDQEQHSSDEHERLRFKRNLNFRTDDAGALASKTFLNTPEWKQVFEKRLDEQDQMRENRQQQRKSKKQKDFRNSKRVSQSQS